jgi:hypothetical protein
MRRRLILAAMGAGLALVAPSPAHAAVVVQFQCSPAPADCQGWYRSDVTIDWTVVPDAAIVDGCRDRTFTADTPPEGNTETCLASWEGEQVQKWRLIKVDKTAPSVTTWTPSRPPDANGWYRAPLSVAFGGIDATSGILGCSTPTYVGPDAADGVVAGTCTDVAGNSASGTFALRYDATGPDVTAAKPARRPDHRGWYNRPVAWTFEGRDATSGLAECPRVTYAGPDDAQAPVTGSCRDRAGNVSERVFRFRYDATPPAPVRIAARPRDRAVALRLSTAADVESVRILRRPGRRGSRRTTIFRGRPRDLVDRHVRNRRRYRYTVVAVDPAGNAARSTVGVVPRPRLIAPATGAVLHAPPTLRWTAVRGATYYNVQLLRNGRKVLSAWPARARLGLRASWRFRGHRRTLDAGTYRWRVWPGFGARSAARFGRSIGSRTFAMSAPAVAVRDGARTAR